MELNFCLQHFPLCNQTPKQHTHTHSAWCTKWIHTFYSEFLFSSSPLSMIGYECDCESECIVNEYTNFEIISQSNEGTVSPPFRAIVAPLPPAVTLPSQHTVFRNRKTIFLWMRKRWTVIFHFSKVLRGLFCCLSLVLVLVLCRCHPFVNAYGSFAIYIYMCHWREQSTSATTTRKSVEKPKPIKTRRQCVVSVTTYCRTCVVYTAYYYCCCCCILWCR